MENKRNCGITLIALVITIIVLLILAGVSISMLTGENGILQRAADARLKSEESTIEEDVMLEYANSLIKKQQDDSIDIPTILAEALQSQDPDATVDGTENNMEVYYKNYRFTFVNGEITQSEKAPIIETVADTNPGDITKNASGTTVSGTSSNPYLICSIEDLVAFSDIVNEGLITSEDIYVKLENNLNFSSDKSYVDSSRTNLTTYALNGSTLKTHTYSSSIKANLTTGTGWEPIGLSNVQGFKGTFDGNSKEIQKIYINYTEETSSYINIGLFASNYGTIKNLTITGNITGTMKSTYATTGRTWIALNIAGISGDNFGTINNCTNYTNVTGIEMGGIYNAVCAAGIVSVSEGNIINCTNRGQIKSITSSVDSWVWTDIAGICAESYGGNVSNSCNYGSVCLNNTYQGALAGIVGANVGSTIKKCYNVGALNAVDVLNLIEIGGIVGNNDENAEISNCYNIGNINATSSNPKGILKGGIIGYEGYLKNIKNNYNGTDIGAIGGIDLIGVGEKTNLSESSIINYINNETVPNMDEPVYAIDDRLKPGIYVKYDTTSYNGSWRVLSNDGINVELISDDIVENKTISNDDGYKNAVSMLNTVANKYLNNTYAISARSVGATSASSASITNSLEFNHSNYTDLTDYEFYKDFEKMLYSDTYFTSSGKHYWLASRYSYKKLDYCAYNIRSIGEIGYWDNNCLFLVLNNNTSYVDSYTLGVRPVITLKSTLKVLSGSGTKASPYILAEN